MSGKIKGSEYDAEFRALLHQYKLCESSFVNFEGIEKFVSRYQLDHCQTAKQRIKIGQSSYKGEETDKSLAIRVMDITQKMIGAQDLLEININEVDQVLPAIKDI